MTRHPITLTTADVIRLVVGLAVQPIVAGAVAFFFFPVFLLDGSGQTLAGGRPQNMTDAAISVALGTGILATTVTGLVIPMALWLTMRFKLLLRDALLLGLGFANSAYLLMALMTGGRTYGLASVVRGTAFSSLLGLTGAMVFWAIALRPLEYNRNPNDG